MLANGWDFKETAQKIETVIGVSRKMSSRRELTSEEARAAMRERWASCIAIEPGDPVSKYLAARLGVVPMSKVLRFDPQRRAMVALMQAPDGRATMVHSTLLTATGAKENVDRPRLMMRGSIAPGSAVRLTEFTDTLGIAEGIETALSATVLTGIPCWAALNEGQLRQWAFPSGVKKIVIFGDNDVNFVGQAATYILAKHISLMHAGPAVEVRIPDKSGADWNDVLLSTSN